MAFRDCSLLQEQELIISDPLLCKKIATEQSRQMTIRNGLKIVY